MIQTAACSSSVHQREQLETQILVTVLCPNNTPVVGVVLRCHDQDKIYEALTGKNGIATFKLEDTERRIVKIGGGIGSYLDWTPSEKQKYITFIEELRDSYYCDGLYWKPSRRLVSISVGSISEVKFQFKQSSRINGRILNEEININIQQEPICSARISNHGIAKVQKDGSFTLGGIPQQQDNEIYTWTFPDVYISSLKSEQLNQDDVDVGLIKIKPFKLPAKANLDITVRPENKDRQSRHTWYPGITMIHESGEAIFSFWGDNEDSSLTVDNRKKPPPLPAGRYWLAPGTFLATDLQLAVIDSVRSGIIDENTDLKSIVMKAGETTTETIILNEVADRIIKFIEKTDWKRENVPQKQKSDDE